MRHAHASGLTACLLLLAAPAGAQYPAHPATTPAITAADLAARDRAIADDAFQGRGPGTKAGEAAADWIAEEMRRIGLVPGNHGSYFQDVPSVSITLDAAASRLSFATPRGALSPAFPADAVYWTPVFKSATVSLHDSPLVFVGYGVVAPEYRWDDYAGIDVRGKTVVLLINDPGNEDAHPDPAFFKGHAMTYYGRWTYKFEEAARHGAAAVMIVHETIPAAYGWQVVRNSNSGAKSWLDEADSRASMVPVQGWITLATARTLFARAGLDYDAQKKAANTPGFKPVVMGGETMSAELHSTVSHMKTRNVIGMVRGSAHPDDVVLYTAHWDHLGVKPDVPGPDKIYNGAVDNGMGVASILEIGQAFVHDKPPPQRSIGIVCWTLEEQGLLGSQYFAQHPVWKLSHIVGGINIDANLPEGRAHDMALVGNGASQMEDLLAAALRTQHRVISPDPEPEKGHFYRSDHISLAKVGVPMLDPDNGFDLVVGGTQAGRAVREAYTTKHYHQPSDEYDPNWDLSGPVSDLQVLYALGHTLANSTQWPDWLPGNEFRAIRDRSRS
jgi:Zn-dependent M28 family amino/carboxypeptidase